MTDQTDYTATDLSGSILDDPRFQPIEKWDWSYRELRGIRIRYGLPRTRKRYRAVCVIVGGLCDFGEQYFELTRDLDGRQIKPIIIDLPGQGGSGRYLKNPHKRHSAGFDALVQDISVIMDEIVLSAAVDLEDNHKRLPIVMIGHSMGGHMVLRYLAESNKSSKGLPIVSVAALTAPMLRISILERIPFPVRPLVLGLLSLFPRAYVPGGSDWSETYRTRPLLKDMFTSDPVRFWVQKAFFSHPDHAHLVSGSPTNKWLLDAARSCRKIERAGYLEQISIPVMFALAGRDRLVSNSAIRAAANRIKSSELMEIEGAFHEILMEKDESRNAFLDRFFTFLENNVFNRPDEGKSFIL